MQEIHIVWDEEMNTGVVFRKEQDALDLMGGTGSCDLSEAFFNLHAGEVMTHDRVTLSGVAQ